MKKFFADKKRRIIFISVTAAVLTVAIVFGICVAYVSDYYRADTAAIEAFAVEDGIEYKTLDNGILVFEPEGATKGFIFYPGGKVEYTAYIPLMKACAAEGILCVLVEMPFNLAVLNVNAADGICEKYPNINSWYIGGHSLGGSMAASYAGGHTDTFDGLVLLGSYSTEDLSKTSLRVLSIFGSEDRVMNRKKYDKYKGNLPKDFKETVIDGGCHAYFGMYGAQEGDGTPTVTCEEQIKITAKEISELINS